MGWSSANPIFSAVCEELQQSFLVPENRRRILVTLIKILQDCDWDTENESLYEFRSDPVAVQAFADCGVYPDDDELEEAS